MAKVPLQKIRVTGLREHYEALVQYLHDRGDAHLAERDDSKYDADFLPAEDPHFVAYDAARMQFFLDLIRPRAAKKSGLENILTGGKIMLSESEAVSRAKAFQERFEVLVLEAEKAEEAMVRAKNEVEKLTEMRANLAPYAGLDMPLQDAYETETAQILVGRVPSAGLGALRFGLAEVSPLSDMKTYQQDKTSATVAVVVHRQDAAIVAQVLEANRFSAAAFGRDFSAYLGQTPADAMQDINQVIAREEAKYAEADAKLNTMAEHYESARILADVNGWKGHKNAAKEHIIETEYLFGLEAWLPSSALAELKNWAKKGTLGEVDIEAIAPEENEKIPVLLGNGKGIRPFHFLTEMYGMPGRKDVDPTPYMAPFFILFFGICLSDVGYGLLLVLVSTLLLSFGKYAQSTRDTLKFILYCGLAATVGGVLLGGYFGMTMEQAPGFLKAADGSAFKGQILKPLEGAGPLTFLVFSLVVGMAQILAGTLVEMYKNLKNRDIVAAFADSLCWFLFLLSLFLFAGTDALGLPKDTLKTAALGMAGVLVLTQGRSAFAEIFKTMNPLKWLTGAIKGILSGLLGLYGAMNYLSDILSYSRLMALGLATGVVAFAMNTTAGVLYDMIGIPGISHAVGGIMLLFGHGLNFALSMLGASIHSMRLQFIEFFKQFFVGGGIPFKAFARRTQHLLLRS